MASSHGNTHSESAKTEQIIIELFAKSLHIILESRSPFMSSRNYSGEQIVSSPSSSSSSSSSMRPRDKWFNLALKECPENLDLYRQSNLEPMVVDVILVQRPVDWDPVNYSPKRNIVRNLSSKERYPFCWNSDQEELGYDSKSEKIIERWVVQYESGRSRDCGAGNRRSSNTLHTLYKKSVLLLRSLYVTVRLLPAYKIFRDLNSSGQLRAFTLTHRVSSFVEPFTRKEEMEMQRFGFTPLDTSCGRLCVSVVYRSSLADVSSGSSTPMSPQFIPDYVGSPLADPLKKFPALPHGSPSSLPFSRRHSWSFDLYKASTPSISFSPSPTYSEPHASMSNPSSRRFPPVNLPPHPPETSLICKKDMSYDEYYPSSNFTPSSSPSPPIRIPGSSLPKAVLRSESAPVNIPAAKLARSPILSNKQSLPPSPPLKGTRVGTPKSDKGTGLAQTGATVEKLFFIGKDDTRKYSGVKISSNSSPRISFSRSSSRSFQDDFDDSEFLCPFDVEDDDMTDPGSRPSSFDQKPRPFERLEPSGSYPTRKSQDAAVGALVHMLKKAAPLHQDFSSLVDFSQDSRRKIWSTNFPEQSQISEPPSVQQAVSSSIASSGLVARKTTADALEELQGYKEMVKDLLVRKASRSNASSANPSSVPKYAGSAATGLF